MSTVVKGNYTARHWLLATAFLALALSIIVRTQCFRRKVEMFRYPFEQSVWLEHPTHRGKMVSDLRQSYWYKIKDRETALQLLGPGDKFKESHSASGDLYYYVGRSPTYSDGEVCFVVRFRPDGTRRQFVVMPVNPNEFELQVAQKSPAKSE